MVKHREADDAGGLDKASRSLDVFPGGSGVTGWMVVDDHNGGCIAANRFFEDFSWMRGTGVQQPSGGLNGASDHPAFGVEQDDPDNLLSLIV